MIRIQGRRLDLGIAVLLFILNFMPAFLLINEGLFHMDSVILAQAVEKTYQTGILQLAVNGRVGAVLINAILYFPFYLAGQNADLVTRLSSVLFQALSAVAAYFFIRALLKDRSSAFFAALLFSFTPLYFMPNTYGKEHGMSMFFLLMAFCTLQRGLKRQGFWLTALASCLFAFAVAVREGMLVMLPVYILFYVLPLGVGPLDGAVRYASRFSPRALMAFLLPLVAGIGWLWVTYLGSITSPILMGNADLLRGLNGPFSLQALIALDELILSVTPLVVTASLLAIVLMWKAGERAMLIFLGAWAAPFFFFASAGHYTARHLDVVAVPVYVLAGYTLGRLAKTYWMAAAALAVCGALMMFAYMYPMLVFRHSYDGEKRFAQYVRDVTEPGAVIITENQYVFMNYYGQRKTLWQPLDNPDGVGAFVEEARKLLKAGIPVYYTHSAYVPKYEAFSLLMVTDNFKVQRIGAVLSEDFHWPELQFCFQLQKLYRVVAPKDPVDCSPGAIQRSSEAHRRCSVRSF